MTPGSIPILDPELPKYQALAQYLESQILDSTYRVGDKFPSDRELASQLSIAPMTVRRAMDALREKGMIVRRAGHGTVVIARSPQGRDDAASEAVVRVALLGLSPSVIGRHADVNWRTRLMRFQGIVDAAAKLGVSIRSDMLVDPTRSPVELVDALSEFAGIILHEEVLPEAAIAGLSERGIPMVAINCYPTLYYCSHILTDYRRGALAATRHLHELGHERIGIIVGDPASFAIGLRLNGYRDALHLLGLEYGDRYVVIDERGSSDSAVAACRRLLAMEEPPTAIFTTSDQRALGIIEAADSLGVSIPRDLSIVGFDDLPESAESQPPLTTIHNPIYEGGEAALRLLVGDRDGVAPSVSTHCLASPLIVRGSTLARV